ncbi:MAG TPA: transglutaminase-like domain-containing protein [Vicinamibacterales bacterium]|nr:transglutaminase-like domain-containing protein [Vicinamibacterales bacterium]
MRLFHPVSRRAGRAASIAVLAAWGVTMGFVVTRAYVQARSMNLATDLARYGTSAEWRGVYYRGEKIGFTVSQTTPTADGFELQEDARLQMSLLGATTPAAIRTTAQLDREFGLRTFEFSLDPGTGPVRVRGRLAGKHVSLTIETAAGTESEERDFADVPVLSVNLPRRLANLGLRPGARGHFIVFDPATLRNEPVDIEVGRRELVSLASSMPTRVGRRQVSAPTTTSIPAFRVDTVMAGIRTSSWITDTGDVVREESQAGFMSIRETPDVARRMAVSSSVRADLLAAAAVVPVNKTKRRIDDPRDVRRLRLQLEGADLASPDLQGAGQSVAGDVVEVIDARSLRSEPADRDLQRYLRPEMFIESDDPAIHAEAEAAVLKVNDPRTAAERLTRRVNAMLDKKPTVSLPSAKEVLRTRVGDCNEHTALYVAMARSIGIPSRTAVGLAYSRGAFYYHAWPEVYIDDRHGRGLWLPVDPTFNQFPADATHIRLARGGLDKQAVILPLVGHLKMRIVDLELAPNSTPILVGRGSRDMADLAVQIPVRTGMTCWATPTRAR